jgi:hypothetical protein
MSIDVRRWHRHGLLHAGQRFAHALTWGGEPTEGIGVLAGRDGRQPSRLGRGHKRLARRKKTGKLSS